MWELVLRALENPNGRLDDLDPGERRLLKEIATPLELGTMHEGPFVLGTEWRERFTKAMSRHGVDEPTVRELRSWIDDPDARGLTPDLERLIILAFATDANRSFQLHGGPAPVADPSAVSDDFKLIEVDLPSDDEWKVAKERAAAIFGIPMSDLKTAQNLDRHGEQIRERAASLRDGIRSLRTHTEGTLEPTLGIEKRGVRSVRVHAGGGGASGDACLLPMPPTPFRDWHPLSSPVLRRILPALFSRQFRFPAALSTRIGGLSVPSKTERQLAARC